MRGLIGALMLLAFVSEAHAVPVITEPTSPPYLASNQAMPGNGALLFIDDGSFTTSFVVTSPAGETVAGTYAQVWGTYWAWRPSTPLTLGQYLIESTDGPPLDQRNGLVSVTFPVVDAVDLSRPVLNSAPSVSLITQSIDPVCCTLWTDFGVQSGGCAPTTELSTAVLDPGLSSSSGALALGQFLFTIWPPEMAATGYASWSAPRSLTFAEQAPEYCYEIEAIAIFDSTVHTYAELTPRCAAHGELGELGSKLSELPVGFYDRARCTQPPTGFERAWCEHNADCEGSIEAMCVMFDHLCKGGPLPTWMPAGSGGTGSFGGIGGGGGGVGGADPRSDAAGAAGAAGTTMAGGDGGMSGSSSGSGGGSATAPESPSQGCSVALAAASIGPGTASSWLLGLALARLARRRRSREAR